MPRRCKMYAAAKTIAALAAIVDNEVAIKQCKPVSGIKRGDKVITIYQLKPRFQALLRPIVVRLDRIGVTANTVTLFAMFVSCALGGILFVGASARLFLLLPLWMFLRMALNAVDGMLAREFGHKSSLGLT